MIFLAYFLLYWFAHFLNLVEVNEADALLIAYNFLFFHHFVGGGLSARPSFGLHIDWCRLNYNLFHLLVYFLLLFGLKRIWCIQDLSCLEVLQNHVWSFIFQVVMHADGFVLNLQIFIPDTDEVIIGKLCSFDISRQ